LVGQWLSDRLGQSFFLENRSGAGGNVATEAVVNAPPDGYTLLVVNDANAANATLYEKLNFNFVRDIAPVASIVQVPNVLEVNPAVPAKTVPVFESSPAEFAEFIADETEKLGNVIRAANIKPL
jgi:tripartite-type tricarboxylate transporter receptor subunit TctC